MRPTSSAASANSSSSSDDWVSQCGCFSTTWQTSLTWSNAHPPLGHCVSHLHRECPRCFIGYCLLVEPSATSLGLTHMVPQLPRSPVFDQPKHPSVLLITASHRFTASLPHSSSRQVAYPTPHAPRQPVVASDEADKLPHLLHVLAWLTRAVCCFHHYESHCGPSQSHHLCTSIGPGAASLNFVSPRSKLTTPCDFAWLYWCRLTFHLPKLWTGLLLRPPELVHSAHCRYAFSRLVFSPRTFGAGARLWACVSSARASALPSSNPEVFACRSSTILRVGSSSWPYATRAVLLRAVFLGAPCRQ